MWQGGFAAVATNQDEGPAQTKAFQGKKGTEQPNKEAWLALTTLVLACIISS